MEISLSIFLFLYFLYLCVFAFFTFFNIWHMVRFGFASSWAYSITLSYILISVLAVLISFYFIAQFDWTQPVSFFNEVID